MINTRILLTSIASVLIAGSVAGQQFRVEEVKNNFSKDNFCKISGAFSATGSYYDSNIPFSRDPFNYYLSGNVNFRFFNMINLPFSFNITNEGNSYGYPTLPNRFSLHPSYKWATLHLGDISTSYSPYTMNGHMFTGVAFDLTPDCGIKASAMYGRLQKEVEYDEAKNVLEPAYKRMGYGSNIRYDHKSFYLGTNFIYAKDEAGSLQFIPDSLGVLPHENLAIGIAAGIRPLKNLLLTGEYACSFYKEDLRSEMSLTEVRYEAYKLGINYQFLKNNIGINYERIDPGYKTLGAYYFNNDFENITVCFTTLLFSNKLAMAFNAGIEHDDVDNNKYKQTSRFVGSANISFSPNVRFNVSANYSNFQTHANIKSQFDYINQTSATENLDTLNFTQLSHNLNLSSFYYIMQSKTRSHSININMNYQQSADKYGDYVTPGNLSWYTNAAIAYTAQFIPQNVNFRTSFNTTYNYVAQQYNLMLGPVISANARFFKKRFLTGISGSYNQGYSQQALTSKILNLRANLGYLFFKRHNLTISAIWQNRKVTDKQEVDNINASATYSYSF